jgi:hypothetical protein
MAKLSSKNLAALIAATIIPGGFIALIGYAIWKKIKK